VLEGFRIGARLGRGRSYARKGQVLEIDFEPGVVTARVQGSRARPYAVDIELEPVSPEERRRMAEALAGRPRLAARLLAGEMPEEVEEVCREAGVPLFPEYEGDLETGCSCPDWSNPCKHIAAVYYLVAEELDRDPFLLFKLRGFGPDDLRAAGEGREAEGDADEGTETGAGSADPAGPGAGPSEPLPTDPDRFWGSRPRDARVEGTTMEEAGPVLTSGSGVEGAHAVHVHALGRVPFWRGELDPQARIETMIDRSSSLALELLAGAETSGGDR